MSLIEKTGVNDVYQKIAQNFSDKRYNQWSWITEFINEANKYPHRKNVLDVGCGNGRNMEGWINASVYGLDKCREFIKMCIQKDKDVVEADMTAIPFQKDFFDFIISVASFHHLSTEVRRVEALSEMRRVIKPNGKLLLSVWSRKQPPKTKQAINMGIFMLNIMIKEISTIDITIYSNLKNSSNCLKLLGGKWKPIFGTMGMKYSCLALKV